MTMIRSSRFAAGELAVAMGALTCAGSAQAQDDLPNMTLRWAHFVPPTWGSAQADQLFVFLEVMTLSILKYISANCSLHSDAYDPMKRMY